MIRMSPQAAIIAPFAVARKQIDMVVTVVMIVIMSQWVAMMHVIPAAAMSDMVSATAVMIRVMPAAAVVMMPVRHFCRYRTRIKTNAHHQ